MVDRKSMNRSMSGYNILINYLSQCGLTNADSSGRQYITTAIVASYIIATIPAALVLVPSCWAR